MKVLSITPANSSKVVIALPPEAAQKLVKGVEAKDPTLQAFLDDITIVLSAPPAAPASASKPVELNFSGTFYPAFTTNNQRYSDAVRHA